MKTLSNNSRTGNATVTMLVTVLGMSGLRLDRLRLDPASLVWVSLWLTSVVCVPAIFDQMEVGIIGASIYVAVAFGAYYGGLTLVLGLHGRRWLTERLGPKRAACWFELALGIAFTHQALAQGMLVSVSPAMTALSLPKGLTTALGLSAVLVSLVVKIWSTHLVGLDIYYYRDMFLQSGGSRSHASENFVSRGPYRWLKNPMYGMGNLSVYGMALIERSIYGLVASALAQVFIYTFYVLYERPFVHRYYLASGVKLSHPIQPLPK